MTTDKVVVIGFGKPRSLPDFIFYRTAHKAYIRFSKFVKPEVGVDQKYADGKNGSLWIREAKVRLVPVKN